MFVAHNTVNPQTYVRGQSLLRIFSTMAELETKNRMFHDYFKKSAVSVSAALNMSLGSKSLIVPGKIFNIQSVYIYIYWYLRCHFLCTVCSSIIVNDFLLDNRKERITFVCSMIAIATPANTFSTSAYKD